MRNVLFLTISVLLMLLPPLAQAVKVNSIYKAEVPVASQSAKDKSQAAQDGMAQVLLKVSGNSQIMDNPTLKANLNQADKLAQEYSYSSPKHAPKATPFLLTINYDADGINKILRDVGSPIWGQNRPLILLWLALDSKSHPLDIVDGATNDTQKLVAHSAKQRGLPIILPVMDMTDIGEVSVNDVVNNTLPTLQKASKRYASNAILTGHITEQKDGFNSHWQLVMDADKWSWDVTGKNLQDVMTGIVNNVADTLASRYGVVVSDAVQSQLTLRISGVKQQADLIQVMHYLQHLTPVADVLLQSISGSDVTLNINLRGNKQAFIQAVSIGKNLVPVANKDRQDDTLLYQWTQ